MRSRGHLIPNSSRTLSALSGPSRATRPVAEAGGDAGCGHPGAYDLVVVSAVEMEDLDLREQAADRDRGEGAGQRHEVVAVLTRPLGPALRDCLWTYPLAAITCQHALDSRLPGQADGKADCLAGFTDRGTP